MASAIAAVSLQYIDPFGTSKLVLFQVRLRVYHSFRLCSEKRYLGHQWWRYLAGFRTGEFRADDKVLLVVTVWLDSLVDPWYHWCKCLVCLFPV